MKTKTYTEAGLDALIHTLGFEHKQVISYAKKLEKQEKKALTTR